MTDLETTKLCAEAMGYLVWNEVPGKSWVMVKDGASFHCFAPLQDDAQAMALVKRFPYQCLQAMHNAVERDPGNYDLNRACVTVIAEMQSAKVTT